MDTIKKCIRCKNEKSIDEFHIDKFVKDGHRRVCNQCACYYTKRYYEANKDKLFEKVACECGRSVVRRNLKRHEKSLIHNDLMTEKNSIYDTS